MVTGRPATCHARTGSRRFADGPDRVVVDGATKASALDVCARWLASTAGRF